MHQTTATTTSKTKRNPSKIRKISSNTTTATATTNLLLCDQMYVIHIVAATHIQPKISKNTRQKHGFQDVVKC